MEIHIFGKANCDKCHFTEDKINKYLEKNSIDTHVVFKDMSTPGGLVEGTLRDVSDIPSTFVVMENAVLYEVRGHVPRKEDLETMLKLLKENK